MSAGRRGRKPVLPPKASRFPDLAIEMYTECNMAITEFRAIFKDIHADYTPA
jgi:hypothetical protein